MSSAKEKVILAMSGGVDSSVAAALLLEQGYDVTGVFMCLGTAGAGDADGRGCCSPQDAADARRVADRLGIELFVLNLQEEFGGIIDYFVDEYLHGRTPNPCIHCNARIKFGRLIRHADSLGARFVATGHYARIADTPAGRAIFRASAIQKDQSYALFAVARQVLPRMLLPIGDVQDKARVREIARSLGLAVHDKPDSQEICFVADDDYVNLLAAKAPAALKSGNFVDSAGAVLGRHDGYGRFTIGQRKGMKVAMGVPYYVTRIDPASGDVTIGPRSETLSRHLRACGATWHGDVQPGLSIQANVQIRYNHRGAPGVVKILSDDRFEVEFAEAVPAITPGQAAVIYIGERLLGGGWIQ
jgi:tRNA-specific 2-thiouridylase